MSDGFRAAGRYESVDPPRQVTFTWGFADDEAASHTKHQPGEGAVPPQEGASAMPAGSTRVTVTLAAAGKGTRLTLRHDNLPSAELAAAHRWPGRRTCPASPPWPRAATRARNRTARAAIGRNADRAGPARAVRIGGWPGGARTRSE